MSMWWAVRPLRFLSWRAWGWLRCFHLRWRMNCCAFTEKPNRLRFHGSMTSRWHQSKNSCLMKPHPSWEWHSPLLLMSWRSKGWWKLDCRGWASSRSLFAARYFHVGKLANPWKKLCLFKFWCIPNMITHVQFRLSGKLRLPWFANSPATQAVLHSLSLAAFGPFFQHRTGGFSDSGAASWRARHSPSRISAMNDGETQLPCAKKKYSCNFGIAAAESPHTL